MNPLIEKWAKGASDAGALAKSIAESGIKSVSSAICGVRIFGSIHAQTSDEMQRDETHYLLVPFPGADSSYVVYTKRIIPAGVGANNSLPKARIFHVPDESGRKILEAQLLDRAVSVSGHSGAGEGESEIADRLDELAAQIDEQTQSVTGGLVLIGGTVAFINPLVGLGIAASSLLPAIGGKTTKAGAGLIGDKLRARDKARKNSESLELARKEINKLDPELFHNPLLNSIDALITNELADYDPFIDSRNQVDSFENFRYYELTAVAVSEVYGDVLKKKKLKGSLSPMSRKWIEHLSSMAEAGN